MLYSLSLSINARIMLSGHIIVGMTDNKMKKSLPVISPDLPLSDLRIPQQLPDRHLIDPDNHFLVKGHSKYAIVQDKKI